MFGNKKLSAYKALAIVIVLSIMTGCATYRDGSKVAFSQVQKGNYPAAIKEFKKTLKPEGDDRLVYFMEIVLLQHLNGEYNASNQSLSSAAQIADSLYTQKLGDSFAVALSNPRNGVYRGTKYERAFIHYYKALNYIHLAAENPAKSIDMLEGARIESRQVDIILSAIKAQEGTYKDAKDKKSKLFGQLMDIYRKLDGGIDTDSLIYREDAYIRYMSGAVYESNGEYDDARIAYQQAAELYENGYSKQYSLGDDITEQAWFDTIRMMQWAGGYEDDWPRLAEKKLSATSRDALNNFKKGEPQLLLIEHLGMIPPRDELNIKLTVDRRNKELILTPIYSDNRQEKLDQFNWFYAMYADKGLLGAISNFKERGVTGIIQGWESKRIGIGPAWSLAKKIGLIDAIGLLGTRITVPYYRAHPEPFGESEVWVNNESTGSMATAESLAQLALQEQLVNASQDLQEALGRESLKSVLSEQASKAGGQGDDSTKMILSLVGKIATTASSQAETRNWLTLPYAIRIKRSPLQTGKNHIKVISRKANNSGTFKKSEFDVEATKGQLVIIRNRSASATMNKKTRSAKTQLEKRKNKVAMAN